MKSVKPPVQVLLPARPTRFRMVASILGLLMLCWLAFFWDLGSIGLVDETEPLFAEASRQMLRTGDWITPYFNGETRFDQPPLIYWLQAIAYQSLGGSAWAVCLPSVLLGLALTSFFLHPAAAWWPNSLSSHPCPTGKFQLAIPAVLDQCLDWRCDRSLKSGNNPLGPLRNNGLFAQRLHGGRCRLFFGDMSSLQLMRATRFE